MASVLLSQGEAYMDLMNTMGGDAFVLANQDLQELADSHKDPKHNLSYVEGRDGLLASIPQLLLGLMNQVG